MDIDKFISDRRTRWNRLEHILGIAESSTAPELGRERVQELVQLYRHACSDLNQARSYTANPELLSRLNQLTGRAYRFIYRGSSDRNIGAAFRRLLFQEIPATFRRERYYVITAALAMFLGAVLGAAAVLVQPSNGERLIPADFFAESPRERVEKIEKQDERVDTIDEAAAFGAFLYTHNIQVSFLAFSLGALTLLGGYWLLFYNGAILGAVAAMYYLDGVQLFFFAWVGPHGALELPAIVFGAAAGLKLGHAFLLPGEVSRANSVRAAFPAVWRMMIATALVLVVAGLIEGSFSQFSSKSFPYELKITVALILFASLMAYLFVRRVGPDDSIS